MSNTSARNQIGAVPGFIIGGLAACAAVTFSNPWEVVKTRLQLQGELARANANIAKPYKNVFQAFFYILKHEKIRGIQKGLGPAYAYQLAMNGVRLGLYDPIRNSLVSAFNTSPNSMPIAIASGGSAGVIAATVGSPLFLVKTRMQSHSKHVAVGHQHNYTSTLTALKEVYSQSGVRGLFHGVGASMLRTGVGSSAQLPSYFFVKRWVMKTTGRGEADIVVHAISSLASGFCVCLAMNPFDVISTRMYNQKHDGSGKGVLYKNTFDCFIKTLKTEGITGLYKGFNAHYLRIGPHTILTLVFLEQGRGLYVKLFAHEMKA
ncbi:4929_t:CDS:2 [Paraglomus occultum]|uniref:4929_t:CDS:1 n=1 Tax=Paraglomus occultum TaxID=144539 RepID=A0A9N8VN64_9GLOM|nr:4929_t:CDS:2 [Paraglomus occultum]